MIKVSVIIPAEKENENLRRCLKALGRQTFKNFETIVIESQNSKCKIQNLNNCFAKISSGEAKLKIINKPEFSRRPAVKRNFGVKYAKGEILAFLDDDCIPERDWLETGTKSLMELKFLKKNGIGAVVGPMLTPKDSPFLERVSGLLWESWLVFGGEVYRNRISYEREVSDYPCANFFMRKADFLKLGGFDERFWPGEDTKLCLEIVRGGGRIFYDPSVVVYHRRRPLFGPFLEQVGRYARQRGRFAGLFPKTSRKLQYFLPSLFLGYLGGLVLLGKLVKFESWVFLPLFLYMVLVFIEGARVGMKEKSVITGLVFIMGVIATHFVYGVNFLRGLFL